MTSIKHRSDLRVFSIRRPLKGKLLRTTALLLICDFVSGDLHGVQPDPVAADILRKEPEQETFVRLRITPYGTHFSKLIHLYG